MSLDSDEPGATAAQLIMTELPTDDSGANTADRYDWQAAMAAADGLALYLGALDDNGHLSAADDSRIVCEHHEDWVVVQVDDAEIVSAKHRDPSYGAYTTINQLIGDGGLAHLYIRWRALKEKPTCRLVTTAGLASGKPPQALENCLIRLRNQRLSGQTFSIISDDDDAITSLCQGLLKHSVDSHKSWETGGVEWPTADAQQRDQAARFLSTLSIQHGQLMRTFIEHAAPSMYAKPVRERLGLTIPDEAVWEAVLSLFRARMRAAGPMPNGLLPKVLAYKPGTNLPGPVEIERSLASRIVVMADIDFAIKTAITNPGGYQPLARFIRTNRMAIKMAKGNCSDNSIERAEQLRLDYQEYWRTRINNDASARVEQERLRRLLLRVIDNSTDATKSSTGLWGHKLWSELQGKIDSMPSSQLPEEMDSDLLLGGISDLANRCQVWFSDRFDIEAEIASLRAQRGDQP